MFKTTSDLCITKTVCLFRSAFSDQRKKLIDIEETNGKKEFAQYK